MVWYTKMDFSFTESLLLLLDRWSALSASLVNRFKRKYVLVLDKDYLPYARNVNVKANIYHVREKSQHKRLPLVAFPTSEVEGVTCFLTDSETGANGSFFFPSVDGKLIYCNLSHTVHHFIYTLWNLDLT